MEDPFDSTRQLGLWSLIPAEKSDCYRKATIEVIAASQVIRKYTFPNAFVVDYKEDYGDLEGVGTFRLMIKQKKGQNGADRCRRRIQRITHAVARSNAERAASPAALLDKQV